MATEHTLVGAALSCVIALSCLAGEAGAVGRFTRAESRPVTTADQGCCTGVDVLNFGHKLDFAAWEEGTPIDEQFRSMGLLVGTGATPLAPGTSVQVDYSRSNGCQNVLVGDPLFLGRVFFLFTNPVQNKWARVQQVGASVGYCDDLNSAFIAAYDWDGNLLESKFNDRLGYQFLSIQHPTADIACVLMGACVGGTSICYPDQGGWDLNCLSFSNPVSSTHDLPDTVAVPEPPTVTSVPMADNTLLVVLGLCMAGTAAWFVGRSRRVGLNTQS